MKSWFLFPLVLPLLLSACHHTEGVSAKLQAEEFTFDRIAVVPFIRMDSEDASIRATRCPLCGSTLKMENLPSDAEKIVQDIFVGRLKNRKKIEIIAPDITGAVFDRVSTESAKLPLTEILKKIGSELKADGVVVGYVSRYTERKGYAYSVEHPASVAFEIHLVRTTDGEIVWKNMFDMTQQSLMENMFRIVPF